MSPWLKKKSKLQKLQSKYCKLMKYAYKTAVKNKDKSDLLHQKANEILVQIKNIENQSTS